MMNERMILLFIMPKEVFRAFHKCSDYILSGKSLLAYKYRISELILKMGS